MSMNIVDYDSLQAAVADWMNRSDLSVRILDFIGFVEAEVIRRVRRKSVRASVVFNAGSDQWVLPSDCAELRSLRLDTGIPSQGGPIKIVTQEVLSAQRASSAPTGRPRYASVLTGSLMLVPTPDADYQVDMIYYQKLTPLSTGNETNWLILEAPDVYLYGALVAAEPYVENDERMPMWKERFEDGIAQLEKQREQEEFNASIRPARLPVVFG